LTYSVWVKGAACPNAAWASEAITKAKINFFIRVTDALEAAIVGFPCTINQF
jgi:hypothetical protein